MTWFAIIFPAVGLLAGVGLFCWAVYGRRSGPTGCIGCGKCVADGVCILTGKKVPGNRRRGEKAVISPLTIGWKPV